MPVNPVIRTEYAWRLASDPLVQQIQSSPFVEVLVPDGGCRSTADRGRSGAAYRAGVVAAAPGVAAFAISVGAHG